MIIKIQFQNYSNSRDEMNRVSTDYSKIILTTFFSVLAK